MDFKKYAKELGKRGGQARAKSLSKEKRSEIARNAAAARWKNRVIQFDTIEANRNT